MVLRSLDMVCQECVTLASPDKTRVFKQLCQSRPIELRNRGLGVGIPPGAFLLIWPFSLSNRINRRRGIARGGGIPTGESSSQEAGHRSAMPSATIWEKVNPGDWRPASA